MRIDWLQYKLSIKYTDWVVADSTFDYQPYIKAYHSPSGFLTHADADKIDVFNIHRVSGSGRGWIRPLLEDNARLSFDDDLNYWKWVCAENHDNMLCNSNIKFLI